jgi:hypothetical protein
MPDVDVSFMHPTDGRVMSALVEAEMTAQEVIDELLASDFIPAHGHGYQLSIIESGNIIGGEQTLAGAGVRGSSKIRVLPVTEAG